MTKRWILGLVLCLGLYALPAAAQFKGGDASSFEIGGGFAYRSFADQPDGAETESGVPILSVPRVPMYGFFGTVSYNLNGFLGVATDFDWTRANVPNDSGIAGKNTFSSLMVGPQIYPIGHHKLTPFGHVEVGLAHFSQDASGTSFGGDCGNDCTATDGSFAVAAGGGLDYSLTRTFAIRVAQFDWDQSRMFEPGAGTGNKNQNNWIVKAGIIVRLGKR